MAKVTEMKMVAVESVNGDTTVMINESGSAVTVPNGKLVSALKLAGPLTKQALENVLNIKIEGRLTGNCLEPVSRH